MNEKYHKQTFTYSFIHKIFKCLFMLINDEIKIFQGVCMCVSIENKSGEFFRELNNFHHPYK